MKSILLAHPSRPGHTAPRPPHQDPTRMRPCIQLFLALPLGLGAALPALAQQVRLNTTMGDILLELEAQKAPRTVANFLQYVKDRHYDGTVFHRVINGFMIQGGGMTPTLDSKPTRAPIALEARTGLRNVKYSVAMARTAAPDSATAQFFVNVADNAFLDADRARDGQGYAVFARVVAGTEVVERIQSVPTVRQGPHGDVPATPIQILKATVEK